MLNKFEYRFILGFLQGELGEEKSLWTPLYTFKTMSAAKEYLNNNLIRLKKRFLYAEGRLVIIEESTSRKIRVEDGGHSGVSRKIASNPSTF